MIKVFNQEVHGMKAAIRGMRNPMDSWDKSDSGPEEVFYIGDNDIRLANKLCRAGTEHRKFLRQIQVSMDIVAPRYWWTEFDTYKIGTTSNSCSTMHKLHSRDLTLEDFSHEHLRPWEETCLEGIIRTINNRRAEFVETKNKDAWWQMIQLLPQSYNQRRTVTMNYEVAMNMIRQRTGHKLDEWNEFVKVLENLPYMKEFLK